MGIQQDIDRDVATPETVPALDVEAYASTMERVRHDLVVRYRGCVAEAEIEQLVNEIRARLEASGRHLDFIPALTENAVRAELADRAAARGEALTSTPKILFVCERNEGRSQVAAALAEHLSGGHVIAQAAGLRPTGRLNPHAATVLAERGIDLLVPLPSEIQDDVLDAADVLVLIGLKDAPLVGQRTVHWDISDPYAQDLDAARGIADQLEQGVRQLLAELEVPLVEGAPPVSPRRELAHA